MDLKKPNEFYLYNCIHHLRTLAYRSKWMILECYYTKRFHDSYYLQRCTHLCLKNKPSKFKGAGTRKDKYKRCKNELSVVLEEFHNKVFVWLLRQYTSTANVTINTFLFWNSPPICFASRRKEPNILTLVSNMVRGVKHITPVKCILILRGVAYIV